MQTDTITINCVLTGSDYVCTTNSWFSGGEMFISLCLVIGIVLAIIAMAKSGMFSVWVHRKFQGVNQLEGKEDFKI